MRSFSKQNCVNKVGKYYSIVNLLEWKDLTKFVLDSSPRTLEKECAH